MRHLLFLVLTLFISTSTLQAQCDDCYSKAFLGIYTSDISKKKADLLDIERLGGSYVTGIIQNTAAEKAGLQAFDYVFGIDEYRTDEDRSLTSILKKYEPGDKVTVHFYRNGKEQSKPLTLGKKSDARYDKKSKKEDPFLGVEQTYKSGDKKMAGVRVNIINSSTAEAMGLEDGDIITHINGFPILDWADMGAAIDMMEVGKNMKVTYIRDNQTRKASGEVKSLAATKYKSKSYSYFYSDDVSDSDDDSFNFNFNFNNDDDRNEDNNNDNGKITRIDIDNIKVGLEDITSSDINRLSSNSLNLNNDNNLNIRNLEITPKTNKNVFLLKFSLPNKNNTAVNIYNTKGRNIYNYDLGSFSGEFEDNIDIAQNGIEIYYLKITQGTDNLVKKIVLSEK